MQYYRLWIYACNAVLLTSVVAFVATVVTLVTDYRAELTSAFELFQPCFVYGIIVLGVQGCGLTIFGCIAARRLSSQLLKIYWYLLLCLLGSDIIIGATWMAEFEGLMTNLTEKIRHRHSEAYGNYSKFTQLWNEAQQELRCCGVESPTDFKFSAWWLQKGDSDYAQPVVPESCCIRYDEDQPLAESSDEAGNDIGHPVTVYFQSSKQSRKMKQRKLDKNQTKAKKRKIEKYQENSMEVRLHPDTQGFVDSEDSELPVTKAFRKSIKKHGRLFRTEKPEFLREMQTKNVKHECLRHSYIGGDIYHHGCAAALTAWLQQSAALLFVLNYCVLAFVKVCFLAILRHELKEMIQKIELLKTQDTAPLFPELAAALGVNKLSPQLARKTIGQMAETSDVRDIKSHQMANGSAAAETEPLLYSNHTRNSSDNLLSNKRDELKSDKEQSARDVGVGVLSPTQNAKCSLGNAIGQKGGNVFNNNDYFEMKELKGKSRQTEI